MIGLQPPTSGLQELYLACSIWRDAQVQQELYRYYKPETRGLDQEGLLEDLSKGSPGDVVLLHACAHNPTGALSFPHLLTDSLVLTQATLPAGSGCTSAHLLQQAERRLSAGPSARLLLW